MIIISPRNGEGAWTLICLPPNSPHTQVYGTLWEFPPKSALLPPLTCTGTTITRADEQLRFWSREGASGNEVSGYSPGTQYSCFHSSHSKRLCQKEVQQFPSCLRTQNNLFLPPRNKLPSSTNRPRGIKQQLQPRRRHATELQLILLFWAIVHN